MQTSERIRSEVQRISEVRQHLRKGDANTANEILRALDHEVPQGVMQQERDALKIDALFQLGQRQQAELLVEAFRSHYPESPFSARWPG